MVVPDVPRLVVLWGPDYEALGEIGLEAVTPSLAVALSRGRYPKGYPHLDPNEDGVLAAAAGQAAVLAVVDGHNGFDAARVALETVRREVPALLAAAARSEEAAMRRCLDAVERAVREASAGWEGKREASGTALCLALVSESRLTVACRGDCAALVVRGGRARRVAGEAAFLGPEFGRDDPAMGQAGLRWGDKVVVASDGVAEFLGRGWRRRVADVAQGVGPADLARRLVEAAFKGGAGDNIAVGVLEVQ